MRFTATAALLALSAPSASPQAGEPHAAAVAAGDAGQLFQSRCASCHVAPDQRFETDRAWIEQVRDTA